MSDHDARTATLRELYETRAGKVSDKWSIYLAEYQRHFQPYRDRELALFEIGVQNGGSLDMWARYFPRARVIVGCDVDRRCAELQYADPRIRVVVADANSDDAEAQVAAHSPSFDIVIDDGSHTSGDICRSFACYFPRLEPGGLFVVEDLHCSYWQQFQGGLFDPFSSIAFFKRLVDVPNREHWGVDLKATDLLEDFFLHHAFRLDEDLLAQVHSVEFVNSLCIVRKCPAADNTLGLRVIAGTDEAVVSGHLPRDGTHAEKPDQTGNAWSTLERLRETSPAGILGLKQQREDAERRLQERERSFDVLGRRVARSALRVAAMRATRAAQDSRLGELRLKLDEQSHRIETTTAELGHRSARVTALDELVTMRDRLIGELQAASHRDALALQASRDAQAVAERGTEAARLEMGRALREADELRAEVQSLRRVVESQQSVIGQRNERIGELNEALMQPAWRRWWQRRRAFR